MGSERNEQGVRGQESISQLVGRLRAQLEKEEQTLTGMEKAKEFFPAE